MTTPTIRIRKHCQNCGMNAMFSNEQANLSNYGSVSKNDTLTCNNCGTEETTKAPSLTRKEMENFCADALGHDDMSDYSTDELRNLLKTTKGEYAHTLWHEACDYNNK